MDHPFVDWGVGGTVVVYGLWFMVMRSMVCGGGDGGGGGGGGVATSVAAVVAAMGIWWRR